MKTIYKYPLQLTDYQEIKLPYGASFIHVGPDPKGLLNIWAAIDTEEKKTTIWKIYIVGTGNPTPNNLDGLIHLGSFVDRAFMWHVFIDVDEKNN